MTTVVVFGTFDGIHPGHESLFEQARRHGDRLVAIVARDEVVEHFKGRRPVRDLVSRLDALRGLVDDAVAGDEVAEQGSYSVLAALHPDVVAFGYDQPELRKDFESQEAFRDRVKTVTLEPFKPEIYKSSLLRRD